MVVIKMLWHLQDLLAALTKFMTILRNRGVHKKTLPTRWPGVLEELAN